MSDIFISYKSEDREMARTLAEALEGEGYSTWWDRKIPPGKMFDQIIKERLDVAKCVIVLWSKASVSSDWVLEEASEGLRRKILVPAMIDDVEIPLGFRRVQAANLIGWKGDPSDSNFELLLASVKDLLGGTYKEKMLDGTPNDREEKRKKRQTRIAPGWKWSLIGLVLLLVSLFYSGAIGETCANRDLVLISGVVGFPLTAFLIVKTRQRYKFLWILVPSLTFLIGMPYGHRYGTITRSQLFGFEVGTKCQVFPYSYFYLAGLLLTAMVVDFLLFYYSSRNVEHG